MNWKDYSSLLFDFEEEQAERIQKIKIDNFNAWQIVKAPLYFNLILSPTSTSQIKNASLFPRFSFLIKLADLVKLAFFLALVCFRKKSDLVLIAASDGDKFSKQDGLYKNFLVDYIVLEGIIENYIYCEEVASKGLSKRGRIKVDCRLGWLAGIIAINRISLRKDSRLKDAANNLFELLEDYFNQKEIVVGFSKSTIYSILLNFEASFKAYSILLKIINPRVIISSEQPGSSLFAAAARLGITAIDIQHGLINRFDPQYMYSPRLKPVKKEFVLPDYLGVYGQMHKEIYLKDGFWDCEEIQVIGSARLFLTKMRIAQNELPVSSSSIVLLPTQWASFNEIKILLTILDDLKLPNIHFQLKIHPTEPASNTSYYKEWVSLHPEKYSIAPTEDDIHKLLLESKLVIGFDSTVLFEAVSLGCPAVTIGTNAIPLGIHSFVLDEKLKDVIQLVSINEKETIKNLVRKMFQDDLFYSNYRSKSAKWSSYIFDDNYVKNCHALINKAVGSSTNKIQVAGI